MSHDSLELARVDVRDAHTEGEYRTIKDLVIKILADERANSYKGMDCRDSDKLLSYRVYERIARDNGYKGIFIPFELFGKLPSFETISRCRRYIQNDLGLYQPTLEATKKRRKVRQDTVNKLFKEGTL
jgi:hypothetical protein